MHTIDIYDAMHKYFIQKNLPTQISAPHFAILLLLGYRSSGEKNLQKLLRRKRVWYTYKYVLNRVSEKYYIFSKRQSKNAYKHNNKKCFVKNEISHFLAFISVCRSFIKRIYVCYNICKTVNCFHTSNMCSFNYHSWYV